MFFIIIIFFYNSNFKKLNNVYDCFWYMLAQLYPTNVWNYRFLFNIEKY
jgi:hypothetical protein